MKKHIHAYATELHDLDRDAMWSSLESELLKKRQRSGIYWLTGGALIALFALVVICRTPPEEMVNEPRESNIHTQYTASYGRSIERVDSEFVSTLDISENQTTTEFDLLVSFQSRKEIPIDYSRPLLVQNYQDDVFRNDFRNVEVIRPLPSRNQVPQLLKLPSCLLLGLNGGVRRFKEPLIAQPVLVEVDENKYRAWDVGFHMGSIFFRNQKSLSSLNSTDPINKINIDSSPLFGIDAGILFSYRFSNRLRIGSSFRLIQLNERISYDAAASEIVQVMTSQGEATVTTLTERKVRHTNHLRFLHFPVQMSLCKDLKHSSLELVGGFMYSRLIGFDGLFYQGDGVFVHTTALSELVDFHSRNNWLWTLGLSLKRPINDNLGVKLTAETLQELTNNLNSERWVRHRKAFRIGLALSYRI